MSTDKKIITTSVRIDPLLNTYLKIIAEYENRSMSNLIQTFLYESLNAYLNSHTKDNEFLAATSHKTIESLIDLGINVKDRDSLRSEFRKYIKQAFEYNQQNED